MESSAVREGDRRCTILARIIRLCTLLKAGYAFQLARQRLEPGGIMLQWVQGYNLGPDDFAKFFEKIVLVEKLREVRALIGFTRIESPRDFDTPLDLPPERRMRLSRRDPSWIPSSVFSLGRRIRWQRCGGSITLTSRSSRSTGSGPVKRRSSISGTRFKHRSQSLTRYQRG